MVAPEYELLAESCIPNPNPNPNPDPKPNPHPNPDPDPDPNLNPSPTPDQVLRVARLPAVTYGTEAAPARRTQPSRLLAFRTLPLPLIRTVTLPLIRTVTLPLTLPLTLTRPLTRWPTTSLAAPHV